MLQKYDAQNDRCYNFASIFTSRTCWKNKSQKNFQLQIFMRRVPTKNNCKVLFMANNLEWKPPYCNWNYKFLFKEQ